MSTDSNRTDEGMGVGPFYDAHCHYQDARLSSWFSDPGETVEELGVRKAVVNGTAEVERCFQWLQIWDSFFCLDCILERDDAYEDAVSDRESNDEAWLARSV